MFGYSPIEELLIKTKEKEELFYFTKLLEKLHLLCYKNNKIFCDEFCNSFEDAMLECQNATKNGAFYNKVLINNIKYWVDRYNKKIKETDDKIDTSIRCYKETDDLDRILVHKMEDFKSSAFQQITQGKPFTDYYNSVIEYIKKLL